VESVGPLHKLEPGGAVEYVEKWFLFKTKISESEQGIEETLLPLVQQTAL
jgi:hypothetical protein